MTPEFLNKYLMNPRGLLETIMSLRELSIFDGQEV